MNQVAYYLSAGNWGDGKSVCLWRTVGGGSAKVARFQSELAAKEFAADFDFPLSRELAEKLNRADHKISVKHSQD